MDPTGFPTTTNLPLIPDLHTGRINYSNGDIYIGEILNGKRHGEGNLIMDKGHFQGTFENDLPIKGKLIVGDTYYIGDVLLKEGVLIRQGKGYMKYNALTWYDGDWVNDQRHGHGLYCEYRGKYEGKWINDRIALQHVIDLVAKETLKRVTP